MGFARGTSTNDEYTWRSRQKGMLLQKHPNITDISPVCAYAPVEICLQPLVSPGFNARDAQTKREFHGIHPSTEVYRNISEGHLPELREVGTYTWSSAKSFKCLVMNRAYAKTLWTLLSFENIEWYYLDGVGKVQGPFKGRHLWIWYEGGYIYRGLPVLPVRAGCRWIPKPWQFVSIENLVHANILDQQYMMRKRSRAWREHEDDGFESFASMVHCCYRKIECPACENPSAKSRRW
ncbi:hypothetical protein BSKO_03122 [Bryopsis sp. KO-2023]|nr:hypothetical protein BSKO_03122 [Bryopsis sp. KO-2023]